jgi:hypothetical protein
LKADRDGAADKNRAAETVKEMLSDDTGGGDPGYAECRAVMAPVSRNHFKPCIRGGRYFHIRSIEHPCAG